jgi:hypothetical protein
MKSVSLVNSTVVVLDLALRGCARWQCQVSAGGA